MNTQNNNDLLGSFQLRVRPWLLACFGEMIAGDREERNHRFLEEALELVQSTGCTASEAHQLVDYVYGRPVGEPAQEVGGVMVTLAALCLANNLDMHADAETELARIWTKVEQIRAKQAAKPRHSPLPAAPLAVLTIDEEQAARSKWTVKQWYEHVGAWENPQGEVCFGSVMALGAMLKLMAKARNAAQPEPTSAGSVPVNAQLVASLEELIDQHANGIAGISRPCIDRARAALAAAGDAIPAQTGIRGEGGMLVARIANIGSAAAAPASEQPGIRAARPRTSAEAACWCQTCRPITLDDCRIVLCPTCGNKRCPRANDHRHPCGGSNEPGQPGSSYPARPSPAGGV